MFFLKYLRGELLHRPGKTITVSLGLAVAGAVIVTIISISQSLSAAQKTVLDPLANVGTDIMVSRTVKPQDFGSLDDATRQEAMKDNRVQTDFSKLGQPGEAFTNDTFLPGSMLTFAASDTEKIDKNLVAKYAGGLVLNVLHQQGTIPKLAAEIETGGQRIGFTQRFEMSEGDRQAFLDAQNKAMADLKKKGIDPNSEEGREALRDALPRSTQVINGEVEVPKEVIRQEIGSFATDINTENFTLAGVDMMKTDIGLILPSQIIEGRYLEKDGEIVVTRSFAQKKNYSLNGTIDLGGKTFTLVGIVDPKLFTLSADAYVSLADAQALSGRDGRVNVLLVKAADAQNVEQAGQSVASLISGATVSDASETADQVSGSLVNASNLTNKFIGVTSIVVIAAALVIVSLITVLSVNKRVRELGTLKAIGWSNAMILRQIVFENVVVGLLGAALGVGLGLLGLFLVNQFDISLSATFEGTTQGFGAIRKILEGNSASGVSTSVPLHVGVSGSVLLMGAGVALLGAIVASGFASLKASRMKPQEALRNIE